MRCTRYIGTSIAVVIVALLAVGIWGLGGRSSSHEGDRASSAPENGGGVAVVDLDAVAEQLAADVAIAKRIKDAQTSLDRQLRSLQMSLRSQYEEKSREMQSQSRPNASADAPEAVERELKELEKKLNLQLAEARRTARAKFNSYCAGLVQGFRDEVIPVAREIAASRGLKVLLARNDTVLLAFDESHDITDALVAKLRKDRPEPNARQESTAARPEGSASSLR